MEEEKTAKVFDADKTLEPVDIPRADAHLPGQPSGAANQMPQKIPKDIWDKIAAVAPIISGTLIFAMGGWFTYSYNQQQLRVQEIQTIEKFIPHLMGNDQSKRAAILAISSLTNAELAGKFAQIFASKGTVSALQSIAETGSESDRSTASSALAKALENIQAHENKLNEMETAFQQALTEKNGQLQQGSDAATDIAEADRLERLSDMAKGRGQANVAESLLKQAVNIRMRTQLPGSPKDVISSLRKLADVEQALGNKDEADNLSKKAARLEAHFSGASVQSPTGAPPPPPPPAHETGNQTSHPLTPKGEHGEGDGTRDKEIKEPAQEGDQKAEKDSLNQERERPAAYGENSSSWPSSARAASAESNNPH